MPQPTPLKIVYIAGYGRNGGTLLDRILGSRPDFLSLGEFRFVWQKGLLDNELCNCGQPFLDCPFWHQVLQRAGLSDGREDAADVVRLYKSVDRTRYLVSLLSPLQSPSFSRRLTRYRRLCADLHRAAAEVSGARVLVNSSKFAGYGLVLAGMENVRLYVIHLVRDSRAVAHSWAKNQVKPEVTSGTASLRRYGAVSAAAQWSYRNMASQALRRNSYRYRTLRYEDFTAEPRRTVEALADWLDEPQVDTPFCSDHSVLLPADHTQSGNPMRFQTGEITIRTDDAWRSDMPAGTRRAVTALTWPLLRHYGYLGQSAPAQTYIDPPRV